MFTLVSLAQPLGPPSQFCDSLSLSSGPSTLCLSYSLYGTFWQHLRVELTCREFCLVSKTNSEPGTAVGEYQGRSW